MSESKVVNLSKYLKKRLDEENFKHTVLTIFIEEHLPTLNEYDAEKILSAAGDDLIDLLYKMCIETNDN